MQGHDVGKGDSKTTKPNIQHEGKDGATAPEAHIGGEAKHPRSKRARPWDIDEVKVSRAEQPHENQ